MAGNPNPIRTPEFLAQQKPRYGDRPLGKARTVRFTADVDEALEGMNDRQLFIRAAVEEKLAGHQSIDLAPHIDAVLMSLKPSDRRAAKALFKKLTDRLEGA